LVAQRYPPEVDSQCLRRAAARHFKIVLGLALQKVAQAPRDVCLIARNAQQVLTGGLLEPDRSAYTTSMLNPVLNTAKRQRRTVREWHCFRQSA
jgi:hypothetical protein